MNSNLKINIISNIKETPWGGGNQFLKILKNYLKKNNFYTETIKNANVVIVNSYQDIDKVISIKKSYPHKRIVYRLGPILHYHRGQSWKYIDKLVIFIANKLADQIIFQSFWSKQESIKLGFKNPNNYIISNASNNLIFNSESKKKINKDKTKLIATSWSNNKNKGFDTYKYLDNNLDFTKYEMIFIGNSPIKYKNIKIIPPLNSFEIAEKLKESDIFISAVKYDACSNSIIEALSCGLPVIALDSGSNKEIIQSGGLFFKKAEEIPNLIKNILQKYETFQNSIYIELPHIIGKKYKEVCDKSLLKNPKKINYILIIKIKIFKTLFYISKRINI